MRDIAGLLGEGVRRFPDRPGSWRTLSHTLSCLGRPSEALNRVDEALKLFPDDIELKALGVAAAIHLGALDRALADAKSIWDASPNNPVAGRAYLDALKAAGRWNDLSSIVPDMDWLAPDSFYVLEILGRKLLRVEDRPGELHAYCDQILAKSPGHTNATYFRAVALARLGRVAEAREAMGMERYLSVSQLPIPDGYADGEAFRTALAKEIHANPTLVADPKLKTTRGGMQTLQLRQPGEQAVAALIAQLEVAIAAYVAAIAHDTGPFAQAAPDTAELLAWAVVCGPDGLQSPHRHPGGWLSGVYFVQAPKPSGEDAHRGRLKLGVAEEVVDGIPPWGLQQIEPVPGRLVLFPSYTPHATEPTGVDGARISVAFDVVPVVGGEALIP